MAEIRNIVFSATKTTPTSNTWQLKVQYDCESSDIELRNDYVFEDWFEVWEDDPFNDDKLTGKVGSSTFNPSTNFVKRTLTTTIDSNRLNTEIGREELYVKVFLKNVSLTIQMPTKRSTNLHLKP
jgi:hypothetical protein